MHLSDCEIADSKVTAYLLNDEHEDGGPKSRFFRAFGFVPEDWAGLRDALLAHPRANPVIKAEQTPFGVKYLVRCNIETPDGRNPCINTVWIIKGGVGRPQFVTAYPQ